MPDHTEETRDGLPIPITGAVIGPAEFMEIGRDEADYTVPTDDEIERAARDLMEGHIASIEEWVRYLNRDPSWTIDR